MASEQFSLCWDNFHKNMSSGMNSLLENEDLVDVTLAVEGKYLKAHKMVLSVCSPYFKELFKTNPCKHPIVFMKDVSYVALSDLLQFMYQGEVQVSQENLTTFIKTAEALQIKGLTGDGNGSMDNEVDQEKSVQQLVDDYKPEYKPTPSVPRPKKLPSQSPAQSAPKRQRLSTSSSEVVVPSNVVTKSEPVSNTSTDVVQFKMEPYDQTQTISIQDDDDNFGGEGLDDTAGDDTEDYSMMEGNEEEPQAGTSAEGSGEGQDPAYFIRTPRGLQLCYQKEIYFCDKKYGNAGFWGCSHYRRLGCKARIKTIGNRLVFIKNSHNHTSGGFVDEETYQDETVKVINEDASYKVIRLGSKGWKVC
ncbi:hypothetical protein WA026_007548 [Henosepilachna vigintioctopunctata]|uniref:BTB domain-containing protein n=1 Tax=Henosepilachna vigintioctopunctata TaxID=420089 RepID=A0AAW1UXH4_9CUCU